MTGLIEQVARAIAAADGYSWNDFPEYHQQYLTLAQVTISAIQESGTHRIMPMEPTEKMLEAGWGSGTSKARNIAYNVWKPMVAAAPDPLKEEKK
jgi:hypothetical protein